jgi:nucleotide-binding universal stress UspA family protein
MDRFKKILVPVDGSRTSYECVRISCHLAIQNNSIIHLVHVINTAIIKKVLDYSKTTKLTFNGLVDNAEKEGTGIFGDFISNIKKESTKQFTFVTKVIKGENVDEELINYANANGVDLIVVPQVSKKHAWNVVVGHVAMRLVEFAHIPVLTIPVEFDDRLEQDR